MSFIPTDYRRLFDEIQRELAVERAAAVRREDPRSAGEMLAVLFSPMQLCVLAALFGQPDRQYHLKQLVRLSGSGVGFVHAMLARLEAVGLLHARWDRERKLFQADADAPLYGEMCAIIRKGSGLAAPIRAALAVLEPGIEAAFVYEGFPHCNPWLAPLQLVVVAQSRLPGFDAAIQEAERALNRHFRVLELSNQDLRNGGYFIGSVLARPRVWVIGSEDWLGKVVEEPLPQAAR